MYELGHAFSGSEVTPGTNLLVSGPPMTGKRDVAFDVLAHGCRRGDGAIVVTTKDSGDQVLDECNDRVDEPVSAVGVVDCVSKQQGMNPRDSEHVAYASSPVDMTGIGIELSHFLETFYERGVTENRVLFDSLSTLLMYSDLQTVFRFLHVFTGRVQSADTLGLYIVDSTAHDDQAMSTLRQLFDGEVEVRETDDGSERRLKGVGETTEWRPA
jgi:KaiC/GvpD/RAD55 family RecA-like ATPase